MRKQKREESGKGQRARALCARRCRAAMPLEPFTRPVRCPLFTTEEILNYEETAKRYRGTLCDRFETLLGTEEAAEKLFHFGMVFPGSWDPSRRTIRLGRYLCEENRLVSFVKKVAKKPYVVRKYETSQPGHLGLMFSASEIRAMRKASWSDTCLIRDESLFERLVRAGLRELLHVLVYVESLGMTIVTTDDLSVVLKFMPDSDVTRVARIAALKSLFFKPPLA